LESKLESESVLDGRGGKTSLSESESESESEIEFESKLELDSRGGKISVGICSCPNKLGAQKNWAAEGISGFLEPR